MKRRDWIKVLIITFPFSLFAIILTLRIRKLIAVGKQKQAQKLMQKILSAWRDK